MAASELGKSLKGFIETAGYLSFCCWILESTGRFLAMAIYDCVYGSPIFFKFFFPSAFLLCQFVSEDVISSTFQKLTVSRRAGLLV